MQSDQPQFSPAEQAARDHLAYLCDVAACLATIAWPEAPALSVLTLAPRSLKRTLRLYEKMRKGAA